MPSPCSLRPIILPSARQLIPSPHRPLHSSIIHQHHHRRAAATLRPYTKSRNYAFPVVYASAATIVAAFWLRPQRSTNIDYAITERILRKFLLPNLHIAVHEHLGCQNIRVELIQGVTSDTAPDDDVVVNFADLQMVLCLDAGAASEKIEGNILGVCMFSKGREEMELVSSLRKLLKVWDSEGLLKREGKAVSLVYCKGVQGIWVYGKEGVEVEGADLRLEGGEGVWMSRVASVEKLW